MAWVPEEQLAADLQGEVARGAALAAFEEIQRWHADAAREAAEATAVGSGAGLFDFDDLPWQSSSASASPLALPTAALDVQEMLKRSRQDIQRALDVELGALPLGDPRRRQARIQARVEAADSAADPARERRSARELGRLLCTLQRERPMATPGDGEAVEEDGWGRKQDRPAPDMSLRIDEREALEILRRRADVSLRVGDLQRQPLHAAAEHGFARLVSALLDARAAPNSADFAGDSPLHVAAHSWPWCQAAARERRHAVAALVAGRAEVDFGNARGRTALHIAAAAGDGEVLRALLARRADANARDLGAFTALMWAAGRGEEGEVRALLDAAADASLQAHRGQSAMLFALTNGQSLVCDLLQERVAAFASVPPGLCEHGSDAEVGGEGKHLAEADSPRPL
eukprot:CAMPEP_0203921654 /NCGR_PEP_ID=MMETSP0359-20131031/61782_1 /ASSEMBLY_ACC=CAM_ASM_000338 /TAXON_ID=268821 /ORGANISM="Scrippsiella Hangoei, Strain SHTV-5" /LENGTH=400 /DNA_ID=CAMNT_0050849381 /DNA_START=60 /DNA_END=1259 /DNA_ORIENTATION=+